MLKQRVLTAILLLAGLSAALRFFDLHAWQLLVAGIVGLAAWEWARLAACGAARCVVWGLVTTAAVAALSLVCFDATGLRLEASSVLWLLHGSALPFWLLAVPLWMRHPSSRPPRPILLAVGMVLLLPPALALVQLRAAGVQPLLALMAVVWVADIAAYFTGRAFGRHKLAPAISPGKTWEGAFGAVLAVQAYGFLIQPLLRDAGLSIPSPGVWSLTLLLLTAISIVGDLFESMMKRQAGRKDSSQLLPGHGGILDRIDSLTATLPLVGLYLLSFHPQGGL
ncbi:phosphatidate cytidylyltransferase [Methyloversatilis thermotolerans]|uniref:phosphatidate cytidylyltransferase n=1 Tax=Methyloversatilis thermotolerans TaxID=1346290 RepID=UPI00036191F5|nr:phosphatidate cytidylyltransferase [Methyloversatilis thermotolerans]